MNNRNDLPRVTVLMPVYNGEKFLGEAIESILEQTFKDFEFLIIDDGSTDDSRKIVESFSDSRIRYIRQSNHRSIAHVLNKGISLSQGVLIARMDCDDISLPTRIEKQVDYFNKNPKTGALGTNVIIIDDQGNFLSHKSRPISYLSNRWISLFKPPLMHPTVMYAKKIIKQYDGYKEDAIPAEDFDLWSRLIETVKCEQLEEVLVILRSHDGSVSNSRRTDQIEKTREISMNNIRNFSAGSLHQEEIISIQNHLTHKTGNAKPSYNDYYNFLKLYMLFCNKTRGILSKRDIKFISNHCLNVVVGLFTLTLREQFGIVQSVCLSRTVPTEFKCLIIEAFLRRIKAKYLIRR